MVVAPGVQKFKGIFTVLKIVSSTGVLFNAIAVPPVAVAYQAKVLPVVPSVPVTIAEPPTLIVVDAAETAGEAGEPITSIAPDMPEVVLGQDAELTTQ